MMMPTTGNAGSIPKRTAEASSVTGPGEDVWGIPAAISRYASARESTDRIMGGVYGIRSRRVVLPGGVQPATVYVRGTRIERVVSGDTEGPASLPQSPTANVRDVGDLVVMPGVVDTHVHVNEPGRTEWEGFATAAAAAAAGGVTTIVDMPLNCVPVTTTPDALAQKARAAAGRALVDYAFWGGVIPGNGDDLQPLARAGVPGFKCFLVPSGIDEFPPVTAGDLRPAMRRLAELGAVLLVHAESPGPIERAARAAGNGDPRRYHRWLASRPAAAEQ